ncbi:MAG: hypothetical protein JW793_12590, partial [Acidobacteria bacterium]|nr:hypothetical protein [Acidobacteriota bacterium]
MPSERDYAERLREQAYKTLSPQVKGLESELKAFSDALSAGIYQIERKLEAINRVELPTTKAVLDEILQDVLRRKDQQDRSLALFARELRAGETQEEILGLLLDHACNFFSRAALFAVRNDRFVGWSSRGYSPETARSIAGCSIPLSECPRFREALESGDVQPAPDLYADSSLSFLQAESEETAYLVSLHVMQRPVAVLLAQGAAAARCDALSFLAILTEMRLENVALKILYALTEGTPAAGTPPLPAVELKEQPVEPAIPAGAELVEEKEPESAMEAEPEVEVEPAEEAAEPAI